MGNSLNTRQTLLIRIRNQHDEKSWEEFIVYYQNYVFAVVNNMNISHHDAEDIVQTVMLKSWEKLPEFEYSTHKGRFRGWLATVTRNAVSNFLRKKKWELNNLDNPEIDSKAQEYLNGISLPEIEQISKREWKLYIAGLAWKNVKKQLSEESTEAFIMLADDVPPQEVSKKMGIPIDSLYVYKARIKKRLCQEIKHLEDELG